MSQHHKSPNSETTTRDNIITNNTFLQTGSLLELIIKTDKPQIKKEKIANISKINKFCPRPIKKSIELKRKLNLSKKIADFDFTKKEFSDDFGKKENLSNFYDNKINQKKKMKFFLNENIEREKFDEIRKLNLHKFIFRKKYKIIYECSFCDQKFLVHTSLGGHISRSHGNKKKKIKKNKINVVEKKRKNFLNNL